MPIEDTDFSATLEITDVVNADGVTETVIKDVGISQLAEVTLLGTIVTNTNALNAKLDADTGAEDTDYAETYNLTAIASQGEGISTQGMYQVDEYNQLKEMETNFNAILVKLDADTGVEDEDYSDTYAVDLNDLSSGNGLSQDDKVGFLEEFVDNFNLTLIKLDADASA